MDFRSFTFRASSGHFLWMRQRKSASRLIGFLHGSV